MIDPVRRYLDALSSLNGWKAVTFPVNSKVFVASPRYQGYGKVVNVSNCRPDHLALLLDSGNVFEYPIIHCQPPTK